MTDDRTERETAGPVVEIPPESRRTLLEVAREVIAAFLQRVMAAFKDKSDLLALTPAFVADLAKRLPAWRRVVAGASRAGLAVPGLSVSLGWYDTLTTARGTAAVIQAQRDYFGSHTYERIDNPGVAVHTEWKP